MIMGERMPYADLEVLAELPDGKLSIDLLTREARHSSAAPVALEIVDRLAEWLGERLASHRQATADLSEAHLELTWRTDAVPTVRARAIMFDWSCTCELSPRERKPRAERANGRMWYDRDRRMI